MNSVFIHEVADSFAAVRWLHMKITASGLKNLYYYEINNYNYLFRK